MHLVRPVLPYLAAAVLLTLAPDPADAQREDLAQLARGCEENDAQSCYALGNSYLIGRGVARDEARSREAFRRAEALFRAGCAAGRAGDCTATGSLHAEGMGVARNTEQGRLYYRRGCEGGDPHGCHALAMSHEHEAPGSAAALEAFRQAAVAYGRSCEAGVAQDCTQAGALYHEGRGVSRDLRRAAQYFTRACDGGEGDGCRALGEMHAADGDNDRAAAANRRAEAAYRRTCSSAADLAAIACDALGHMYLDGEPGVQRDELKSLEFFERACAGGYGIGCNVDVSFTDMPIWFEVDNDACAMKYSDGGLRLERKPASRRADCTTPSAFFHGDSVIIEASFRFLAVEPGDTTAGRSAELEFGREADRSHFAVSLDGRRGTVSLTRSYWESSGAYATASYICCPRVPGLMPRIGQEHTLRLELRGTTATLSVDGKVIDTKRLPKKPAGNVRLKVIRATVVFTRLTAKPL